MLLGLALGATAPGVAGPAEHVVWPLLAALLFATFSQLPLGRLGSAARDARFLAVALTGNLVLVPLVVAGLLLLTPPEPALRLGLGLVLLAPCTDWFITFTALGRGDAARATALTPLLLVGQLALLPMLLGPVTGVDAGAVVGMAELWPALGVLLLPLLAAAAVQRWARGRPGRERGVAALGWWPVPLLALVLASVAASHVGHVARAAPLVPLVVGIGVAYLACAVLLAVLLARVARLTVAPARTLAFSLSTRNSFMVLPFALALPAGWEAAALVIVLQSLVELFGMAVLVRLVPGLVFPGPGESAVRGPRRRRPE